MEDSPFSSKPSSFFSRPLSSRINFQKVPISIPESPPETYESVIKTDNSFHHVNEQNVKENEKVFNKRRSSSRKESRMLSSLFFAEDNTNSFEDGNQSKVAFHKFLMVDVYAALFALVGIILTALAVSFSFFYWTESF